jgi:NADH-quinone oxidoreductase subunit H
VSGAAMVWGRLTLTGRVLAVLLPVVAIGGALITALLVSFGGTIAATIDANLPIVRFLAASVITFLITVPTAFLLIYMEMKIIALMNLRIGPDRIGPAGAVMSIVHGLKVLMKEDYTPPSVDVPVFTLAPVVVYLASFMTVMVIPFAPELTSVGLKFGLLYFFAIGGLGVVGLMMAGWSSFNKYSLLGGIRAAAQAISYEIPLTLSIVGIVILTGSLSLPKIVAAQSGSLLDWFIFRQPLAAIIFFIAITAEANRTPFDNTEADQEIVAGFATEYSGMRFGFFFFAEYVNVFIVSALFSAVFLGGSNAPIVLPFHPQWPTSTRQLIVDLGSLGIGLPLIVGVAPVLGTLLCAAPIWIASSRVKTWQALLGGFLIFGALSTLAVGVWAWAMLPPLGNLIWFLIKTFSLVFVFVWMRGTLPRARIDQLMGFAWKWLLPASLLNIFATALAVLLTTKGG